MINRKLKGFTLIELLISMTLTGILIIFIFTGYNQIQKLFISNAKQSDFIIELTTLKNALFYVSEHSKYIEKRNGNKVVFKSTIDSTLLELTEKQILLTFESHTDTFNLKPLNIQFSLLPTLNSETTELVNSFKCDVPFQTQVYALGFEKSYEAAVILKINQNK